jgi:hypothetical protein
MIPFADVLGFAAALLTLAAFAQRRMLPMRMAAIAANVAFISYGWLGGHWPVLALHLMLLPLNLQRFTGEFARRSPEREQASEAPETPAPGIMGWV